jgi:hypothetical protein
VEGVRVGDSNYVGDLLVETHYCDVTGRARDTCCHTYFGKPIPLLHSLVGNPIKWVKKGGSRHTKPHPCDPCGSRLWCTQGGTNNRFRVAHDYVQRVIAALTRRIKGVQVEETPYGLLP